MELKCTILYILLFVLHSSCKENNVCPTINDYYTLQDNPNCWYDIAAEAKVPDITYYGYPVEKHKAVTQDGYILTMFRIPNDRFVNNDIEKRGPVFLQHGWLASSACFVALGNQSLAFLLANQGYDVWLGNFRGTEYSEGHVNLTTSDEQYWQYGFDHLALYDLPTQLEHIVQTTGQRGNIVFIGHSLGTTAAFMYSSAFPKEARQIVKLFILLGPAAQLSNTKSIFIQSLPIVMDTVEFYCNPNEDIKRIVASRVIEILLKCGSPLSISRTCHIDDIINHNDLIRLTSEAKKTRSIFRHICFESPLLMERCFQLGRLILAGPRDQTAESSFPVIANQVPAGISIKVVKHAAGMVKYGLSRYDYGLKNKEIYGTTIPPPYDISSINVPILMFTSTDDWACTTKDALITYRRLSSKAKIHGIRVINHPNFNHGDFLFGKHAKSIVYDPIISFLEKHY